MKNTVSLIANLIRLLILISYVWVILNLWLSNSKQVAFGFVMVSFFTILISILIISYGIFFSGVKDDVDLDVMSIQYVLFTISVLIFTVSSYCLVRETRKQQKVELK